MKLTNEFIEKLLADFHYELTREQLEQDWVFDKKPYYKEKRAWCFRAPDNSWIEIPVEDVEKAFIGGADFESLHGDGNKSDYEYKVMGTVEPKFDDRIKDYGLAFIYGAIKKYGGNPKCYEDLKHYIIKEVEYVGKL